MICPDSLRITLVAAFSLGISFSVGSARAAMITLGASKDATLFESPTGHLSAGGDHGIFVGKTFEATNTLRRGLIEFDLSGIPNGSTINSVSLRLGVTKHPTGGASSVAMGLHRLLGDWGEGNVIGAGAGGGQGGPAANGDATWLHQFRPGDLWSNRGGDFVAQASATASVGLTGSDANWSSTNQLVTDLQGWLANPAINFGWLIRGNESVAGSARRFASSEANQANNRPLLTVNFTLPPARVPGDVNADGSVTRADAAILASFYGALTTANNFNVGEFSGDGVVGLTDMAILQRNLSPLPPATSPLLAAVPEPSSALLTIGMTALFGTCRMVKRCCRR